MNTNDKTNRSKLNLLITEKEQEWRVLLQQQMESLTKELAEKDEKVNLEKLRFRKLKEDFEYNLNLLAERDKELTRYDELFQQLKARDLFRDAEVSEMKIKVADAESKYKQLEMEHVETQKHYQWVSFYHKYMCQCLQCKYKFLKYFSLASGEILGNFIIACSCNLRLADRKCILNILKSGHKKVLIIKKITVYFRG